MLCVWVGRVCLIGVLAEGSGFDPVRVMMKSVRLQGIFVGSREMFERMNRAIAVNRLRPVIDRTFSFGEARNALCETAKAEKVPAVQERSNISLGARRVLPSFMPSSNQGPFPCATSGAGGPLYFKATSLRYWM